MRLQWMTIAIIGLNFLTYIIFNLLGAGAEQANNFAILAFGHIPSVSNDIHSLPGVYQIIPSDLYALTALTSAFMHADIWHLGGNMLFIWVFGDNVEDALGHIKFLIFYLACAYAAAWFHAFVFPMSDAPLVGASGAAAGIVAAYLMLHPKMKSNYSATLFLLPLGATI
ncbi:MAG: rhomboid family intramembrane serine protease [Rhizobiaceae bacterium]|nr:rhomboid family intramembrane serine protease [Rhizobiaceae bacterium]